MISRFIVPCLLIVFCTSLVGCGWGAGKPAPKIVAAPISPSAQARKDLFAVAKKIEDAAAVVAIETYIKSFEDPEQKWAWSDLDDLIVRGSYSIQTKVAYEKWRNATIAENAKK